MAITEHELPEVLQPAVVRTLVKRVLTDELRRPEYRGKPRLTGHCYVASEAAYHLLGGGNGAWCPATLRHEDQVHWFLVARRNDPDTGVTVGDILDITASQFDTEPDYHGEGRGRGFLTNYPSRRAAIVIQRALELCR